MSAILYLNGIQWITIVYVPLVPTDFTAFYKVLQCIDKNTAGYLRS